MSVQKETEALWIKLNEYQQNAAQRINEMPERDWDRRPWTDEDHGNVAKMIQEMTARVDRIESRLDVLYLMIRSIRNTITSLAAALIVGAVIYFGMKVFSWLFH